MTVLKRVANILSVSRMARNSDKHLWLTYAQRSGMGLTPQQVQVFMEMPSPETIRRTRQKLQMSGQFPADDVINEGRYEKFKEVRQNITSAEPEILLENTTLI